jgi:hypothetical protein
MKIPFPFFAAIGLVVLLVGTVALIALYRRRTPTKGPGDAVSPLVAEQLARAVLRRASSWSVAYGVLVIGLVATGHSFPLLVLLTIWLVPLSSVLGARRVLRELTAERARAELRGTVLIVRSPSGQARVAASPRQIERARAHAVPQSTAL